jgi:V/A-type H+-transporting ATPase subunit K
MSEQWMTILGWIGIFSPMALGALGSTIGCLRAGQAACGAMLDAESGFGRFIGVSAFPASQTIYGIVVMFALIGAVTPKDASPAASAAASDATESAAKPADAPKLPVVDARTGPALFGIGVLGGVAIMGSAIGQGLACAAAIAAFKNKAEVFGLSIAPAAFIEGFAVFAMIFAIVAANNIGS